MKEAKRWLIDNDKIEVINGKFQIDPENFKQMVIDIQSDARTDLQERNTKLLERARALEASELERRNRSAMDTASYLQNVTR